jgi:hypothetical protein
MCAPGVYRYQEDAVADPCATPFPSLMASSSKSGVMLGVTLAVLASVTFSVLIGIYCRTQRRKPVSQPTEVRAEPPMTEHFFVPVDLAASSRQSSPQLAPYEMVSVSYFGSNAMTPPKSVADPIQAATVTGTYFSESDTNNVTLGRKGTNRTRLARMQYGARDKFGQGAFTFSDSEAD